MSSIASCPGRAIGTFVLGGIAAVILREAFNAAGCKDYLKHLEGYQFLLLLHTTESDFVRSVSTLAHISKTVGRQSLRAVSQRAVGTIERYVHCMFSISRCAVDGEGVASLALRSQHLSHEIARDLEVVKSITDVRCKHIALLAHTDIEEMVESILEYLRRNDVEISRMRV